MNLILAMRFIRSPFFSQKVEQQMLLSVHVWWPLGLGGCTCERPDTCSDILPDSHLHGIDMAWAMFTQKRF